MSNDQTLVQVYGVSVERIYAVESSAFPSYEKIKNLPNKILLWCGTRSSNLLRHLYKGFLPAVCHLPVPGYMFGKAIVCSDAAAEAARYRFTAVDRPEGYLVLAVASLGEEIKEVTGTPGAEEARVLEEKKMGVKGVGRKTPDEWEHITWRDGVTVPCGKLVPSANKDGPLEYNEYAVYDPKQMSICFLVGVKYEEQNMEVNQEGGCRLYTGALRAQDVMTGGLVHDEFMVQETWLPHAWLVILVLVCFCF
ncbi:unnamed protein product [Miscanthus lutarioriparius]|uniref:Poly [ADP-ribose] polymerase n=1 Tax=Miscanthus lutarioriparius TaxID=422564 RepID=A0A811Q5T8_9POAL|nr:unnamed protein product [Miscanthus lutarioriparius]